MRLPLPAYVDGEAEPGTQLVSTRRQDTRPRDADPIRGVDDYERLISKLLAPERFPHPVDRVERIDTHISTVLLAGDYAYKIKKPLDLGFLDFSRLADRGHYCNEELRLNRRLAPEIYLRRAEITGAVDDPVWDGPGPVIEYAVCMRRFDRQWMLDALLERGELVPAHIDALADGLAAFHDEAAVAPPDSPYGGSEVVLRPVRENFDTLFRLLEDEEMHRRLRSLRDWTEEAAGKLSPVFEERRVSGYVRECHGDLHLANMVMVDGRPLAFDALEFDPALRWIDTMNELAFAVMDLQRRGAQAFAWRLLNGYLERTGDYAGLRVFDFYRCYRALVRAKIHALTAAQREGDDARRARGECLEYIALAETYARPAARALAITHGYSGSGKSTVAQALVDRCGFIRVRSDVERKRLRGLRAEDRAGAAPGEGLYAARVTAETYTRLCDLTEVVVTSGFPVVVDASFLKAEQRRIFRKRADALAVPFRIVDIDAPAGPAARSVGSAVDGCRRSVRRRCAGS